MTLKVALRAVAAVLVIAPASGALAQQGGAGPSGFQGDQQLRQTCANLMYSGQVPRGANEQALRSQCANLMMAGAQAQSQGQAQVQPGQGTQPPQQGAVAQAENVLGVGSKLPPGELSTQSGEKPVTSSLTLDPIGVFTGLGLNAAYERPITPKISWLAGARYAQTTVSDASATNFGAEGGADYFLVGQNNDGLRIGPRLEAGFSRENISGENLFGTLAAAAELGYNYIAPRGLTGSAAIGLGGQLLGSPTPNAQGFLGNGTFSPYAKLGVGYSW